MSKSRLSWGDKLPVFIAVLYMEAADFVSNFHSSFLISVKENWEKEKSRRPHTRDKLIEIENFFYSKRRRDARRVKAIVEMMP